MFTFEVNPSALMLFLGIVLSLLFDYLPPLKNWFDNFSVDEKRKIMTLALVVVGILVYVGSCLGWFVTNLVCAPQDIVNFLYSLFVAGAVNQGFHALTKPPEAEDKIRPLG